MNVFRPIQSPWVPRGVTLIELVIVVAVMGILLGAAIPSYRGHVLRVNRTEAVRLLMQAAMCQQRVRSASGVYDTNRCLPGGDSASYRVSYQPPATETDQFLAIAVPQGAQREDRCGDLTLDQNGARNISAKGADTIKCWNGR